MGLSLAGILMIYGTLDFNEMVIKQGKMLWGWLPLWGIVVQPVAFFLFFLAGMAETKRAPFDLPEGESEIVAGYITEYSSMKFAHHAARRVRGDRLHRRDHRRALPGRLAGFPWLYADADSTSAASRSADIALPYWLVIGVRVFSMVVKVLFLVWLQFMMRWTLPRFRYDQVMVLGWKILLPLAIANLFITAVILSIF